MIQRRFYLFFFFVISNYLNFTLTATLLRLFVSRLLDKKILRQDLKVIFCVFECECMRIRSDGNLYLVHDVDVINSIFLNQRYKLA